MSLFWVPSEYLIVSADVENDHNIAGPPREYPTLAEIVRNWYTVHGRARDREWIRFWHLFAETSLLFVLFLSYVYGLKYQFYTRVYLRTSFRSEEYSLSGTQLKFCFGKDYILIVFFFFLLSLMLDVYFYVM